MGRPKSFLDEFDRDEDLRDGIVVEGFHYPEGDETTEEEVQTITWAELDDFNPIKVSIIYSEFEDANYALREEEDTAEIYKVAGYTRGVPMIYFVRPDELSNDSGYVIAWLDEE